MVRIAQRRNGRRPALAGVGGGGEPSVQVGLAAAGEVDAAAGEVLEEGRGDAQPVSGVLVAVVAERSVRRRRRGVGAGPARWRRCCRILRCSGSVIWSSQPGSHCSKSTRYRSTGGRTPAAISRSRTWTTDFTATGWTRPSWVSGTSPWARACRMGGTWGLDSHKIPTRGRSIATTGQEGDQLGPDLPGAVVEVDGEPVAQHAAAADAAVVVPALVAASGAGEVADAAGAVGAPALPGGPDPGQQPMGAAALRRRRRSHTPWSSSPSRSGPRASAGSRPRPGRAGPAPAVVPVPGSRSGRWQRAHSSPAWRTAR